MARNTKSRVLRYAEADTPYGIVTMGASDKGLTCALFFDERDPLDALRREFPDAEWVLDQPGLEETIRDFLGTLESGQAGSRLALDLVGTAFQREVWAQLLSIPAGSTSSYASVASRIGRPSAIRAVAGACARNHIAVAVPCHRVVRTDGDLGGYRWGLDRKKALLKAESAPLPSTLTG